MPNAVLKFFKSPMLHYVIRRLLQAIPVFLGSTLIIYALVFLQPGDPVQAMFGDKQPSPATLAMVRHQFNLDQPFIIQYLLFIKGIVTLDFGTTFAGRPVIDVIAQVFPNTIMLGLVAFVIEVIIGVGLGVVVGLKRGSFRDQFTLLVSLVVVSVPPLVLGFVLQYTLGMKAKIFPVTVGQQMDLWHLFLPALVLASVSIATVIRLTRSSISDAMNADFVRTARAKGLSNSKTTRSHIFRNSLIPVVTYLGGDLVVLMSGAILTEAIFNVNGIGNTMFKYVKNGEGPAIVSIAALFLVLYILSNIVVDVLYAVLDPRIRYGKKGS